MATSTRRRRSSYNSGPRWLSPKRLISVLAVAIVLVGSVFGIRTLLGLAHLTRQSPLAVIGDLLGGKGGSTINQATADMRRINFAFYGYGGPGHDGAYLTDSILVVSVQPRRNAGPLVAEISVPRDWYVPIQLGQGGTASGRINQAYADGFSANTSHPAADPKAGAAIANPTLEHLLGIHIDHWIGLDFQAFKSAVDAVGGVDVNVLNSFTDYQYPAGECNNQPGQNCRYMTVQFGAGPQHMNGTRALEFARSRHSNDNNEGTDFARSRRQQMIVTALKQKAVSIGGLGNLPNLLNSLGDNVVTDLHVNDLEALYALLKDVDNRSILHVSLDDTNFLYECGYPADCGAAYLYAHDRSYAEIAHYVQSVFVSPAALGQHAPVTIEDASGRGLGASGRWSTLLTSLGLTTTDGGTVRRHPTTQVIDESGGRDAATASWLASFFGVSVTEPPAATASGAGAAAQPQATTASGLPDAGVVVMLGTAEERAFLGDPGVGG